MTTHECFSYLYALAGNATSVNVLQVEGPGKVHLIQKMDLAPGAYSQGIPVGKSSSDLIRF